MGVKRGGRFAAVTNYRGATEPKARQSRGALPVGFLNEKVSPGIFMKNISANSYSGFNLLASYGEELWWMSNRVGAPRKLEPGVYGLGKLLLDSPEIEPDKLRLRRAPEPAPPIEPLFSRLAPARGKEPRVHVAAAARAAPSAGALRRGEEHAPAACARAHGRIAHFGLHRSAGAGAEDRTVAAVLARIHAARARVARARLWRAPRGDPPRPQGRRAEELGSGHQRPDRHRAGGRPQHPHRGRRAARLAGGAEAEKSPHPRPQPGRAGTGVAPAPRGHSHAPRSPLPRRGPSAGDARPVPRRLGCAGGGLLLVRRGRLHGAAMPLGRALPRAVRRRAARGARRGWPALRARPVRPGGGHRPAQFRHAAGAL